MGDLVFFKDLPGYFFFISPHQLFADQWRKFNKEIKNGNLLNNCSNNVANICSYDFCKEKIIMVTLYSMQNIFQLEFENRLDVFQPAAVSWVIFQSWSLLHCFFLVSKYQYSKCIWGQIGGDLIQTQCDQDFNTESNLNQHFKGKHENGNISFVFNWFDTIIKMASNM